MYEIHSHIPPVSTILAVLVLTSIVINNDHSITPNMHNQYFPKELKRLHLLSYSVVIQRRLSTRREERRC